MSMSAANNSSERTSSVGSSPTTTRNFSMYVLITSPGSVPASSESLTTDELTLSLLLLLLLE